MRKTFAALLALAAVLVAPTALGASTKEYKASLTPRQEVPAVSSRGSGTATFKLAANGKSISFRITYRRLSSSTLFAHIHAGKAGKAGNVVVTLSARAFSSPLVGTIRAKNLPKTGQFTTIGKFAAALANGSTYTNVHTRDHPGGEIRGQNRRVP